MPILQLLWTLFDVLVNLTLVFLLLGILVAGVYHWDCGDRCERLVKLVWREGWGSLR